MKLESKLLIAFLTIAAAFTGCGRKTEDQPQDISGSFGSDADKKLLTEWIVDGDLNDILTIDNQGKLVRTVSRTNDNKEIVKTSVESVAVIGKEDFKILKSVSSIKTLKLNGKDESLATELKKIEGKYIVLNVNEAKLFTSAKKNKYFSLKRKLPVAKTTVAVLSVVH